MKRIRVIPPHGNEEILSRVPSYEEMRRIVGGWIERVVVLDHIMPDASLVYTAMIVNEGGLILGLPRNQVATEIYQRNIRLMFADSPNPFRAAQESFRQQAAKCGITFIESTEPSSGYNDDPWIAGTVIFFEDWTLEEVDGATNSQGDGT